MLEAKDQGHKRKCFPKKKKGLYQNFSGDLKKKVFTKNFQAISRKKRLPKNFWGAPQNFNNSKNSDVLEPRTAVADPENFGGGGFEAQNLKNSDVFTKIESDFSAEIGNSNVFFAQNQVVSKNKNKKKRSSPNLRLIFRPDSLRLGRWGVGGDASRNGAELFEIEADFSAKIVTFRLVGGVHPLPP